MPLQAASEYSEYWLKHAIESIKKDYGDIVSIDAKRKDLFKFGRIEGLDSIEQTIQYGGGVFDPPAGNLVTKIKSDDAGDALVIQGRLSPAHDWDILHIFSDEAPYDLTPSHQIRAIRSVDGTAGDSKVYVQNPYPEVQLTQHEA